MQFTKYVIKEGSPAPKLTAVDLHGERRLEFCDAFGVANVGSLTFHELSEPYHHHPKGCALARYETSEGLVMHIAETADVRLPRAPIQLGMVARVPVVGVPPKFDANNVPDGTPGRDVVAEELAAAHGNGDDSAEAVLRAECESLTKLLRDSQATCDGALRDATQAQGELSALRVTHQLTCERLRLAEQDRDALKTRLATEREEHAKAVEAMASKLDRLDKLDLSAAEQPADDDGDEDDAMNGE